MVFSRGIFRGVSRGIFSGVFEGDFQGCFQRYFGGVVQGIFSGVLQRDFQWFFQRDFQWSSEGFSVVFSRWILRECIGCDAGGLHTGSLETPGEEDQCQRLDLSD